MENLDYELMFQIYNPNPLKVVLSVSFEVGIKQAYELSSQLAKNWTRHPSCGGLVKHMDQYHDLYNEGCIKLTKKN